MLIVSFKLMVLTLEALQRSSEDGNSAPFSLVRFLPCLSSSYLFSTPILLFSSLLALPK